MAEKLYKPLLIDSIKATANLPKQKFIGFDVGAESGQLASVGVLGVLLVEAGGAIAQGASVTSDATGKAVTITSTEKVNGTALDAATAAGEVIRIVRGI